METVISALIGASVATVVAIIAYFQWRRDFEVKTRQLAESVTNELIKQRINPYAAFMRELRIVSSRHDTVKGFDAESIQNLIEVLQDAIYGSVGLLASHETRQLVLHARAGCIRFQRKELDYSQLLLRFWAIHLSLRSDLGIHQPEWESAVEKVQDKYGNNDFTKWEELVKIYPWERLLVHSVERLQSSG